jgi:hypothetical protein
LEYVTPDALFNLSERILNDEQTAIQYEWNKARQHGTRPTSCDETCRKILYCETTSVEEVQNQKCTSIKPDFAGSATFDILLNVLIDPWVVKSE